MTEGKSEGKSKVITVRVSLKEAWRAELAARVEETSVNEVFRRALECYVETRRKDPAFVEKAQAIVARDAELVSEL
jgi:hypothetical protein